MNDYRVLIIGPRRGLVHALEQRGIAFSVWQDKESPTWPQAERMVVAPMPRSRNRLRAWIRQVFGDETYTHVIAGTETAVLPASLARRIVGARLSRITTVERCRDKLLMKKFLAAHGIPMTRFLHTSEVDSPTAILDHLGLPVVQKHRSASGGKGLRFIHQVKDLNLERSSHQLLEAYVDAPEASLESFVQDRQIQFVNITHYHEKGRVNFVPAAYDAARTESLHALNRRVIETLDITWGITHLEVYLTPEGPWFGEIALRPPGGYIMNALGHAYGFNPWEAWLAMELGEPYDFPQGGTCYTAVDVFHPGSGLVKQIKGVSFVKNHPATREFRLKVKVGDRIAPREGVGMDVGHLLHVADSPEARRQQQTHFRRNLTIEMQGK